MFAFSGELNLQIWRQILYIATLCFWCLNVRIWFNDVMLKGQSLLGDMNLFSLNEYEIYDEIILECFQQLKTKSFFMNKF